MVLVVHVDDGVISKVYHDQTTVLIVYVHSDVVAKGNHDQKILFVAQVDYVIVAEVYHNHTIFFGVHVHCGVFSEVYLYQTIIIRSPRGLRHCLQGISSQSWPNYIIRSSRRLRHFPQSLPWPADGFHSPRGLQRIFRNDIVRSPIGLQRHCQGRSRPNDIIRSSRRPRGQTIVFIVHVDCGLFWGLYYLYETILFASTWTKSFSSRIFMTTTILFVSHVDYGVIFVVNHDQTILFVAHLNYVIFPEV